MFLLRPDLLGAVALAFLASLPTGFAHYDTGAHPNPGFPGFPDGIFNGDVPGAAWAEGGNLNRVSGWYYGAANGDSKMGNSGGSTPIPGNPGQFCPIASADETAEGLCEDLTSPVTPRFRFAFAEALCDLEVGRGGSSDVQGGFNEPVIDGHANDFPTWPDGTFNDGGIGGACHSGPGYYPFEAYNTPGCNYEPAFAEDLIMGRDVWISTACDYIINSPSSAALGNPEVSQSCRMNSDHDKAFGWWPWGGWWNSAVHCADNLVNCKLAPNALCSDLSAYPLNCPPEGLLCSPGVQCGADGIADVQVWGRGYDASGQGVPFMPAGNDEDPATNYPSCDAFAAAAVFVWTQVIATAVPDDSSLLGWTIQTDPPPWTTTPTYGWIA